VVVARRKKRKEDQLQAAAAAPSNQTSPGASGQATTPVLKGYQDETQRQKIRKKYWQIIKAFQKTLHDDWLDTDDHMGEVMGSIVNLRERIYVSSTYLYSDNGNAKDTVDVPAMAVTSISQEKTHGYRARQVTVNDSNKRVLPVLGFLGKDDLELAQFHALLQHEKMLTGARRLISSLNQSEESLGRRWEELMSFHLNVQELLHTSRDDELVDQELSVSLSVFGAGIVEWARRVYTELAEELYRKQRLVQLVLDSAASDDLLYHENDGGILLDDGADAPLKVAKQCHIKWTRRPSLETLLTSAPFQQE